MRPPVDGLEQRSSLWYDVDVVWLRAHLDLNSRVPTRTANGDYQALLNTVADAS